jgi:DNA-binding MarR family transcriptional regulator
MQQDVRDRLRTPELGPCACSLVRRTARKLSLFYDFLLAEVDLTITQYSLLATIARSGKIGHNALAAKVGMERTTLTRNLRPLINAKWVATATGEDRRQHLLQLTAAGNRKLSRALPLWEKAQREFSRHKGFRDNATGSGPLSPETIGNSFRFRRRINAPSKM